MRAIGRQFGLTKKVADQFGRIIPPGVFEIEEAKPAIHGQQRVMKTEIRRRKAALSGRQNVVQTGRGSARDFPANFLPGGFEFFTNNEKGQDSISITAFAVSR